MIERHQRPRARSAAGPALAALCPDLAMIDISDSLANELGLLAEASGARLIVDMERVPLFESLGKFASEVGADPAALAACSGEEYELLFTTAADLAKIPLPPALRQYPISRIGRVISGAGVEFRRRGRPVALPDATFSHFSGPPGAARR